MPKKEKSILKQHKAVFDSEIPESEIVIFDLDLTSEEKETLKSKFDGWSNNFINKLNLMGIERLLDEYKRLVMSCRDEKSYYGKFEKTGSKENWRYGPGISYEYMNYVSCRTALQIIIESIAPEKTVSIINSIKEFDLILKSLIDKNPKVFYKKKKAKYPAEIYWWEYKLPINVME